MMTGKKQILLYTLPVILTITSLGCGLSSMPTRSIANPQLASTFTPMPTFTPTAQGAAFIESPSISDPSIITEAQLQPIATATPSETITPTLLVPTSEQPATLVKEVVTITVLQDMNVRGGPGTNYPIVGPGPAKQSAKVIGRNDDSSWLQIEYPSSDGKGWIFAKLVQVNGNPEAVAIAQAPPPPAAPSAPAPSSQPEQKPEEQTPPPAPKYQFTPTGWHASKNPVIVHFKGRIKNEDGILVNGFSVLADNGSFRVLSHPTGASQWYQAKGDGEWDIVMPRVGDAQGWWQLTVVKYECDFVGGFDAQCQQYTKLSEDIKVQVTTPEESVINADWICHWDCDKGLYKDSFRRP